MMLLSHLLDRFLSAYTGRYGLSKQQWKAVNAICYCRTARLGAHLYRCDQCHRLKVAYHSCRNRHCPRCQADASHRWTESLKKNLLPVPYFHLVFTVPESLRILFAYNRRLLYNALFKVTSEVLKRFFADPRYIGAEGGFIGVLHTWSQQLILHPHIHYLIPAGGIDSDGNWVASRQTDRFLFPVRALSEVFRGAFLHELEELHDNGLMSFPQGAQKGPVKELS